MTLDTAGPINTDEINIELLRPAESPCDITGVEERELAGVATGAIILPDDFHGKSAHIVSNFMMTSGTDSTTDIKTLITKYYKGYSDGSSGCSAIGALDSYSFKDTIIKSVFVRTELTNVDLLFVLSGTYTKEYFSEILSFDDISLSTATSSFFSSNGKSIWLWSGLTASDVDEIDGLFSLKDV